MNDVVYFDPQSAEKYPFTSEVEGLLGGIGCLIFPDGTLQFAENKTFPDIVYSPRMTEDDLEAFCKDNIQHYQAYYEKYEDALLECEPVPPIERFWED